MSCVQDGHSRNVQVLDVTSLVIPAFQLDHKNERTFNLMIILYPIESFDTDQFGMLSLYM